MRVFIHFALAACIAVVLFSCGGNKGPNNISLNQQKIDAYLASYTALRAKAPEFLNDANSQQLDKQKQGFADFEGTIQANGLSYREFVEINAKVGAIYSVLQGEDFMNQMANMKDQGMVQMDEGQKQIQAQIDDPNVPEQAKEELRKALKEMQAGKEKITADYDKNKGWADLVMDKTKFVCNLFIAKEEIELVKQNMEKITESYTGGVMPKNFNVSEK